MVCLGSLLPSVLQSCAGGAAYARFAQSGSRLTVARSEFMYQRGEQQARRDYLLLKPEQLPFPVCVYENKPESFTSLYLECTHSGCEVRPQHNHLVCPCHGSEFSTSGQVLNPPAEHNLRTFVTTSDSENIYIQLA